MKSMKFFAVLLTAACTMGSISPVFCNAKEIEEAVETAGSECLSLEAAEEMYVFPSNGYVNVVSVYGVTESGSKMELGDKVQYSSMDETIVSVYQDSIRAEGKGTTNIVAEYNGMTLEIPVIVENEIDLDALEASLLEQAGCSVMDNQDYLEIISDTDRMIDPDKRTAQQILDKAAAMKNVRWTPTQKLRGWDNDITFYANVTYEGIPYSQLTQVDDVEFLKKLKNANDFYAEVQTTKGIPAPKYGVDCSGYVSFAFGIERLNTEDMINALKGNYGKIIKIGNYDPNSLKKEEVYAAYKALNPGNAVAYRNYDKDHGHAILVLSNNITSEQLVVYETKNTVPIVSIYNYSDLWSKYYMPFALR